MKLGLLGIVLLYFNYEIIGNYTSKNIDFEDRNYSEEYLEYGLKKEVFKLAIAGFEKLKNELQSDEIITIIDFDYPSSKERIWVVDLNNQKILYHTFVAHGKNSGANMANYFSNTPESYKSSLGFYVTGKTYQGKHGLSLLLDGLEEGINDQARKRAIVIHGADYVSKKFIEQNGRLGRSFGCPALPVDLSGDIINTIANGKGLFIYKSDNSYFNKSQVVFEK
ncbi:MAG: murein L,D-transpeptidase catalytic domain family protein [Cyclobacteriaceae bacterium]|nr:murein L,D-transpeptidase catalytic domain family protein [Cyclobacteriaceae bacterium]